MFCLGAIFSLVWVLIHVFYVRFLIVKKSCLCLLYWFLYCHILSRQSVPSFSFLSCPITAFLNLFIFLSITLQSSIMRFHQSFCSPLIQSKIKHWLVCHSGGGCQVKEVFLPKVISKMVFPWLWVQCHFFGLLPLTFTQHLQAFYTKCNHKHLWWILSDFSRRQNWYNIITAWKER